MRLSVFACALFALCMLCPPAFAQDLASAEQVRGAIIGNTVIGTMAASGPYAEFFDPDGTIRAADYAGRWAIRGNKMCFDYDEGPSGCWAVAITGSTLVWVGSSGAEGSGTIRAGNPSGW